MNYSEEIIAYNIRIALAEREKDHVFPSWTRLRDVFICTYEGTLKFLCDDKTYLLNSGESIFIPQNTIGTTYFMDLKNTAVIFSFDTIGKSFSDKITKFPASQLTDLHIKSVAENKEKNISPYYSLSAFYKYIFCLQQEAPPDKKFQGLIPALNALNNNFQRNLKISEYAKIAYMSESMFRKLFKEYTGKTVIEYRNMLKVKYAEEQILSGKTETEAAYLAGFNSLSFYIRTSKKRNKEKR